MTTTATVRAGLDAFVLQNRPSANFRRSIRLRLQAGEAEAYLFFKSPCPRGATVKSATLRVWQSDDWSGTVTLTAKRVADSWKTGRIDWNNKPGVVGKAFTATQSGTNAGTRWDIDVTTAVQRWADGAPNYGLKVTTDSTTLHRLHSLNSDVHRPVLVVEYGDKPSDPVNLAPSGGAVSVDKPVLRWDYTDPGGHEPLEAVQVQISATNDFSSPAFDSGWVDAGEPELDLTDTAYAGLTDGQKVFWRCRNRDGGGLESSWSDPVSFSRKVKGTLTIDNPAAEPSNYVDEFTPPIAWTFTGTQKAYSVLIAKADKPSTWIHQSGKIRGTATTYTLPRGVLDDDEDYIVAVRVWDNEDRVATPGDPIFAHDRRTFHMNYDATVDPVTNLQATQQGGTPWVTLTWDRGTMPDRWVIKRGSKVIDHIDPASDAFVSGTSYTYTDYGASPFKSHQYRVLAVVTGRTSVGNPSDWVKTMPAGVWIADRQNDLWVKLRSLDVENMEYGEDAATFTPLGADEVTRKVAGMRGLEGTITGVIEDAEGRTWQQYETDLLEMKARPSRTYRLIFADESIPVVLGNITVSPSNDTLDVHYQKRVSFDFWQSGRLPFQAEL